MRTTCTLYTPKLSAVSRMRSRTVRSAGHSITTHSSVAAVLMSAAGRGARVSSRTRREKHERAKEGRTLVADVEVVRLERRRLPAAPLPRRRPGHEHAQDPAADPPHDDTVLLERNGDEAVPVGRPRQGCHGPVVALEHVQARRRAQVKHDGGALGRADGEALRLAVEVDRGEAASEREGRSVSARRARGSCARS